MWGLLGFVGYGIAVVMWMQHQHRINKDMLEALKHLGKWAEQHELRHKTEN